MVKHFSFFITVVTFLLSAVLYYQFDNSFAGMQFIEEFYWIEAFGIKYHLGVDGIALPLIMLTTFTTVLVVLAAWEVIDKNISYCDLQHKSNTCYYDKMCVMEIKAPSDYSDDYIEKIFNHPTSRFSKYCRGLLQLRRF